MLEPSSEEDLSGSTEEEAHFRKKYAELLAKTKTTLATYDNGSDGSSPGALVKSDSKRREAEKVRFPDFPSVPGYGIWLEVVMRSVMDGSGDPIKALVWWSEIKTKIIEELADSGRFIRWDLKIGTALLCLATGHFRKDLYLRQFKCDASNDILRGRQIMKLIMEKVQGGRPRPTLL